MGLTLCVCSSVGRLLTHLAVAPWKVIAIRATQQSLAGAMPGSSGSDTEVATGSFGQALLTTMMVSIVGHATQPGPSAAMVDASVAERAG
jgi:hypothetical protein